MFTGDLTSEQGKQDYENYIMNNVRNEINSYTKQSQINNVSSSVFGAAGSLTSNVIIPTGLIVPFAGGPGVTPNPGTRQDVPEGWLLCSNVAVSRTAYSALFTIIGTTYGVGDGSTTFNVPDLRGRTIAGKDNMGGATAGLITSGGAGIVGTTLGANGGSQTHTLTTAQLASHSHSFGTQVAANNSGFSGQAFQFGGGHWGVTQANNANTAFSLSGTASAGSDNAHLNVQPTIIINYIIKT